MMARLPAVSGRDVVRALERAGFVVVRVRDSHHFLVHQTDPTRVTNIPVHGSRAIKRGTLAAIIRQAGLTVEQFARFL